MDLPALLGKKAVRRIQEGEPLEESMFEEDGDEG